MLFFDGLGLGADDVESNPFLSARLPTLREIFDGAIPTNTNGRVATSSAILVPTDATLGVAGLPQSGTGQTTIFTGVNAAAAIGEHLGPYPNAALRKILAHDNLFQRLLARGQTVAFANAYPPIYFERLARGKARRDATMQAMAAAHVRFRDIDDLSAGRGLSSFSLTNARWRERGADVPLITARQAGQNLAHLARENDFTLFEYSLTDVAGHRGDRVWTIAVLEEVDELLRGVLDEFDPRAALLMLTSDHGNVEAWKARGHTLNPVPTILIGAGREKIAGEIRSLTDITPAVLKVTAD
jgi:hypothetical protein